jgi:hypothetical protein
LRDGYHFRLGVVLKSEVMEMRFHAVGGELAQTWATVTKERFCSAMVANLTDLAKFIFFM